MTPCTAAYDGLRCCRLDLGFITPIPHLGFITPIPHPMPHLAADGTQWDDHGLRSRRGNDPYKEGARL